MVLKLNFQGYTYQWQPKPCKPHLMTTNMVTINVYPVLDSQLAATHVFFKLQYLYNREVVLSDDNQSGNKYNGTTSTTAQS